MAIHYHHHCHHHHHEYNGDGVDTGIVTENKGTQNWYYAQKVVLTGTSYTVRELLAHSDRTTVTDMDACTHIWRCSTKTSYN
jgi:hypothetical protein